MIKCRSRGIHYMPGLDEDAKKAQERRQLQGGGRDIQSEGDVTHLVAAVLDDCAPCMVQDRSSSVGGSAEVGRDPVAFMLTAWLSEAAAQAEQRGAPLPETASGVVAEAHLERCTHLLTGLIPLAGPERPGGSVRVTRREVMQALKHFRQERRSIYDDVLDQLVALHRAD